MQKAEQHDTQQWPSQPEVFPEIMTTVEVAQFLRYDETCPTPEHGARVVRYHVKKSGLPALRRFRKGLCFSKAAVMAWLEGQGDDSDNVNRTAA